MVTLANAFVLQPASYAPNRGSDLGIAIFAAHEVSHCSAAHALGRLEKHVMQCQCGKLLVPFGRMIIMVVPDALCHADIMPRDTNQRHREFRILSVRQNANASDVPAPRQ